MRSKLGQLPHPAIVCSGPQLDRVIAELEAGTYPQPEDAIWRDDLPRDLAVRLAKATGATDEQIAEVIAGGPGGREHLTDCTICGEPVYEGQRVGNYAGCTAHYACIPGREPAAEPEPEPAPGCKRLTIRHTHEDGTLIHGSDKGDGVYELIGPRTAARFRYFPSIGMIGIPQSRDHLAKRWQIDQAAKTLRAAGHVVTVEIDDTPRDVAQVKADRADRLDDRYDRLSTKAQRNAAEAESRRARADQIAERFSGGQPILRGHHSERSARADQKRIEQNDRAAHVAYRKAEHAAAAAAVVGTADAYRERPGVIIRRIDRLEAELRQTMHYINGTRPANDWRGAYAAELGHKPATGEWLEQCQARKTYLEHQIAADREALAAHVANGYVMHSRETIHKGDRVHWGRAWGDGLNGALVTRTNPKTVTLDRTSYPRTLPYEQISKVECPHADLTGSTGTVEQVKAPPLPRRERPAVTVAAPEPRPEPIRVDARSECFTTPAPVVERLLALADLKPGMEVLEPSAGTGAIMSAVAALGCGVYCIEINERLAGVLDELPYVPRMVMCRDFLATEPRDLVAEFGIGPFDRVIMNPPFTQEVRHVLHAHRFLRRDGGLLVAVMSAGVQLRADRASFREFVTMRGGTITALPDDSFAASGTNVRTVIVTIPAAVLDA